VSETHLTPATRLSPYRAIVQNLIEAWNAHDPERIAAFYAPDYVGVDIGQPQPQNGPREIRALTAYYFRAFPDLRITLDEVVVEEDKAVLIWTWTGTQHGTFMRIPATGRRVDVRGSTTLTFKDGLIHRSTRIWDLAGLLRAIGLLPEL
jgi:steroid delta-isomerase-like uncharacterized protein